MNILLKSIIGVFSVLAAIASLVACSDKPYVNSDNSPFACERVLPSQRDRCLERVMTAEEYHQQRDAILAETDMPAEEKSEANN